MQQDVLQVVRKVTEDLRRHLHGQVSEESVLVFVRQLGNEIGRFRGRQLLDCRYRVGPPLVPHEILDQIKDVLDLQLSLLFKTARRFQLPIGFRLKSISDPRVGQNVSRRLPGLDFLAQLVDKNPEIFGLLYALAAPHRIQKHSWGNHIGMLARPKNQEIEFLRREMDLGFTHAHLARLRIDVEIAGAYRFRRGFFAGGNTPQVGAHARQQLVHAQRLGHVIVSAGIQSFNFGFLFPAHGENDDRHLGTLAHGATKLYATHAGHGKVGDYQVGKPVECGLIAALAVRRRPDFVTLRTQRSLAHTRDLGLAIDHQDAASFSHANSYLADAPTDGTIPRPS